MRVMSSCNKSEDGRDSVELYFDPEGRESVADRMVQDGFYVAHYDESAGPQRLIGTIVEDSEEFGTKLCEDGDEGPLQNGMESYTDNAMWNGTGTSDENKVRTKRRSLMDFVTSSLAHLEACEP